MSVHFSSKRADYETPDHIARPWIERYHLNWDVCANKTNRKLQNWFGSAQFPSAIVVYLPFCVGPAVSW